MRRRIVTGGLVAVVVLILVPLADPPISGAGGVEVGWGTPSPVRTADSGNTGSPQVAIDPDGRVFVVWSQYDDSDWRVWANVLDPEVGWGVPTHIGSNETFRERSPNVAVDANGNAVAVWRAARQAEYPFYWPEPVYTGPYVYASRFIRGIGWASPTLISGNTTAPIAEPQVEMDAQGNAFATWYGESEEDPRGVWANRFVPGFGWGEPELLHDDEGMAPWFHLAVNAAGSGFVVWADGFDGGGRIGVSRYSSEQGWVPSLAMGWGGWLPHLAVDSSGNALLVWVDYWGETLFARRYLAGQGWQNATVIAETSLCEGSVGFSYPEAAFDADGNAVVVWRGNDNSTCDNWLVNGVIHATHYAPDLGWGEPAVISTPPSPKGNHVAGVSPGGTAIVAWAEPTETGVAVWATRYTSLGWERANRIGGWASVTSTDFAYYWVHPAVAVDSLGSAVVVWSQPDGTRRDLHYNRYTSQESALQHLHRELEEAQGALAETEGALEGTQEDLARAEDDLAWMTGALIDANGKILLLMALQGVFLGSTVLLFVLYRGARGRRIETAGRIASGRQGRPRGEDPVEKERRWPSIPAGQPLHLITKERILLHLLEIGPQRGAEAAMERTQQGIVDATRSDLRHLSQYLHPLIEAGFVRETTRRVQGGLQRRKVYELTGDGRRQAAGIRERVTSAAVRVRDDQGVREFRLGEVLTQETPTRSLLDVVYEASKKGVIRIHPKEES